MTRGGFAKRLAAKMGWKYTIHQRRALQSLMQAEGGDAKGNPLNTTQTMPGSTDFNSVGVQNFINPGEGIDATVKTLKQSRFDDIVHAFTANRPAAEIISIWGDSEWGTGKTLPLAIRGEIADNPEYLRTLERKEIA